MSKYLRIACISTHTALTIILTIFVGQASLAVLFANRTIGTSQSVSGSVFGQLLLPALLVSIISLIGSFPISLKDTSRMVMERRLLPLIFLTSALSGINILPLHSMLVSNMIFSPTVVAVLYQFSLLFFVYLILVIALFQQGVNMLKFGQLITIGALGCLLLAALSPVSASVAHNVVSGRFASTPVLFAVQIIGIIAIACFVAIFVKEKTRHNALRCGGFISLTLAILGLSSQFGTAVKLLGIVIFAVGVLLVSPIFQSDRL